MNFSQFFRHRAARHGLVWLLIIGFIALMASLDPANSWEKVRYNAVLLAVLAAAIYAHYALLTRFFERGHYGAYAVSALGLVLAGGALLDALNHVAHIAIINQTGQRITTPYLYGQAVGNVTLALVLATVARYVRRGITSHFQMQQLRALQLETELSLLKAQVNQHFLFNTLNNLYGLSLAAPDQMPEALLQLAGLMRYQLDSSRQATVTVGTEAEYLANYIGLEKLRLRENTTVEFTADLPHPDRPLAPLLLLPLVENCFKHAIDPSGDNVIRIHLTQTNTGLTLRTGNSIPAQFRPAPSGLGLPTLRARLAQFYPGNRHRLAVEASDTFYAANLQLVL
ncbi:histidine kinase [Hymenobacter sp. DH14]|uniref:Histidine kinase n=1 Tax=Hymenobacter cyanobacteriorum TaxID=2926463 RepID=A0A9X2AJY9_9BACT|nr:sensor histidine kinase [Hymenobacter cyanobacteriorum]MCI1189384.1 histidine kinase [Hymenobacter cyanobacteriorum]